MDALQKSIRPFSTVVLTGGSSGIGQTFIEAIKGIHTDTVICNLSRRVPAKKVSGPHLFHLPCDLEDPGAVTRILPELTAWIEANQRDGKLLLINNSGFGSFGAFPAPNLEHHLAMIDLNVRAAVELTGRLKPWLTRQGGAVLNVASTAAFQPTPYLATYAATKAFLLHWSLALHEDWKPLGVPVLALCPGPTESQFFKRAGFARPPNAIRGQTAEQVVHAALLALGRGQTFAVTGGVNQLMAAISSRLPLAWQAPVGAWAIRRSGMVARVEAQARDEVAPVPWTP